MAIYYDKSQNILIRDERQEDGVIIRSFNKGDERADSYVYSFSELLFSKKIAEYVILILVFNKNNGYYNTYIIHTETLTMIKGENFCVDGNEIGFFQFSSGHYNKDGQFEWKCLWWETKVDKRGFGEFTP